MGGHAATYSFAAAPDVGAPWPLDRKFGVRLCADGSGQQPGQGCAYHSNVATTCWQEGSLRKCRRTLERFRDCGRGREQVELLTEEVTDSDFQGGAADLRDHDRPFRPSEPQPHCSAPLDSQLGEAVEDILRYADELQQAARRRSGAAAAPASEPQPTQQKEPPDGPLHAFARQYLLRQQRGQSGSENVSPGRARARQCWDEFQEQYQDV